MKRYSWRGGGKDGEGEGWGRGCKGKRDESLTNSPRILKENLILNSLSLKQSSGLKMRLFMGVSKSVKGRKV